MHCAVVVFYSIIILQVWLLCVTLRQKNLVLTRQSRFCESSLYQQIILSIFSYSRKTSQNNENVRQKKKVTRSPIFPLFCASSFYFKGRMTQTGWVLLVFRHWKNECIKTFTCSPFWLFLCILSWFFLSFQYNT